ncbi:glycoside hydrolase family 3 C-terminal domain-containing protein [Novosphingobium sp. KACC 22771]|uniref:glycoside hydrolase family 3 C-terminal domain-containing protein n=1 Tax=Novosphingobium sp. KACC 22771 TaxID=3025670 RepID=UPI002365EA27|nr:glycoside hydrolase family 3 C-terminal domain-containing protein [Novosphingobium sp. KACC 22771]WDF74577.1 glycoside hydrolase family 3 C-terminal domain-containing protein [Novosphingobium sp. KACC 22771]
MFSHSAVSSFRLVLMAGAALCGTAGWGNVSAQTTGPWMDAHRSPADRARMLISAMTLDEKLGLLQGDTVLDGNGTGVNPCVGHISGLPRLGLPALCMGDGPAGVGNGMVGVTQFPAPLMVASTWNAGLMQEFGAALGREHAAKGRNVVLAPTINIIRTPKWGRIAETLSEDPYLTAIGGAAITAGIQAQGVLATPKHFAANNQEWLRLGDAPAYEAIDARVSERALNEIYFPAFEAVVRRAGAGSIMCAYNRFNGTYACENKAALDQLRGWGFDGFVVSDWYFAHRSTVASVKAGMDISMPGGPSPFGFAEFYGPPLRKALAKGEVTGEDIDTLLRHILTPMFRLGVIDRPVKGDANAQARSPAHLALSQRIAQEGSVLLRNQGGVLPLGAGLSRVAIIGDDAGEHVQTTERYGGFVKNDEIKPMAPRAAIRAALPESVKVDYAPGTLGIAPLPAIPASALRDLTATYYASPDFSGKPALTRAEAAIDYEQAGTKELGSIFSARWRGTLVPPVGGIYRFSLNGGGEIRLRIDGREVAYTPKQNFRLTTHGTITLEAGKPVSFELDYSTAPTLSPPELRVGWQAPDPSLIADAVAAAAKADVAVVFVADHVSEGADRTDLRLPGDQDALIEAVAKANPRTVVVLHTAGPVLMPWRDKVAGIVAGWYPGEVAGPAIARLLTGAANPSGKLTVTFPADEVHGPADGSARYPGKGTSADYSEGLLVGYRWYDAKGLTPLYPFGFGLSYTHFGFSGIKATRRGDGWQVRAQVRNLGARAGAEVAQLYLAMPAAAGEPPRQLKGFARVELAPGEAREVSFALTRRDLSVWDDKAHAWKVPAGTMRVFIGNSSRDLPLSANLSR